MKKAMLLLIIETKPMNLSDIRLYLLYHNQTFRRID